MLKRNEKGSCTINCWYTQKRNCRKISERWSECLMSLCPIAVLELVPEAESVLLNEHFKPHDCAVVRVQAQ